MSVEAFLIEREVGMINLIELESFQMTNQLTNESNEPLIKNMSYRGRKEPITMNSYPSLKR